MTETTSTATSVGVRVTENVIELQNPSYSVRFNEFCRTLPCPTMQSGGGKWSKKEKCWQCAATPGAAWRILTSTEWDFQPDASLLQLADGILRSERLRDEAGRFLHNPNVAKTKMWLHQLDAFHFANRLHAALLAIVMGGGKSLVAVSLIEAKKCRSVLILCPKSVLGVWRREFDRHCSVAHAVLILDKQRSMKRKASDAEQHMVLSTAAGNVGIVVVNYETVWRPAFLKWAAGRDWDAVICDEIHRIKGRQSKQSLAAYQVGRRAKFRLGLTGTPMPHSPLDIYGQFRFLDAGIYGTSYHQFRSTYANSGHFGADHILSFKNQEDLAEKMRLLTYEVDGDSADLDLPTIQHHQRQVVLKESQIAYTQLEKEMVVVFAARPSLFLNKSVEGGTVTAANALVKLLRLAQITSGSVNDDDGSPHKVGTEKREALSEILEDIGPDETVVVFCRFICDLENIEAATMELEWKINGTKIGNDEKKRKLIRDGEWKPYPYGEVSGRRKDLTDHAEIPNGIRVMGVQMQAGGVGINLAAAAYGVFMSVGHSLGDFDQCVARLYRAEQKRPVNFYHIVAKGTVDEATYSALGKKKNIVATVLDYLRKGGSNGN